MQLDSFKFFQALRTDDAKAMQNLITRLVGHQPSLDQVKLVLGSFTHFAKTNPDFQLDQITRFQISLIPDPNIVDYDSVAPDWRPERQLTLYLLPTADKIARFRLILNSEGFELA